LPSIVGVRRPHATYVKNVGAHFLYGTYSPENDFELILTVKIETIHPVEG